MSSIEIWLMCLFCIVLTCVRKVPLFSLLLFQCVERLIILMIKIETKLRYLFIVVDYYVKYKLFDYEGSCCRTVYLRVVDRRLSREDYFLNFYALRIHLQWFLCIYCISCPRVIVCVWRRNRTKIRAYIKRRCNRSLRRQSSRL